MLTKPTVHNPDRYMTDLRQVLSQGRKRIGLLIGAGAPTAMRVDNQNRVVDKGTPLIPDVRGLTDSVLGGLDDDDRAVLDVLKKEIEDAGSVINIETILTQVRRLAQAIGPSSVHGLNAQSYNALSRRICIEIGDKVCAELPSDPNPYTEIVSWISGTQRLHSVEIFTPNYDLLVEEAFERAGVPYFDGFSGSHRPFFDAASVSTDELPARWSRLWKLHGSLGWAVVDDIVVRTGQRSATELIYPDHLKYDQVTRHPYSALFERLRQFLLTPDTLLLCTGFSFLDSHICAVLDEALAANSHTAIYAFQYRALDEEKAAARIARARPNLSVYARDRAIISGVEGVWRPGSPPNEDWEEIRRMFWRSPTNDHPGEFLLGDFAMFATFLALTQAQQIVSPTTDEGDHGGERAP